MLNRKDLIKTLSESIATDFFIMMLNPKYRGENWSHREFDIEDYVEGHMSVQLSKPLTTSEKEDARAHARAIWNRWLAQSGIETWV